MRFILYGAGGHSLVVADIVRCLGGSVAAFIDDDPKSNDFDGAPLMRLDDLPSELLRDPDVRALVAIGANEVRMKKADELARRGLRLGTAVHPSAVIADGVSIGEGTVAMAQTAINAGARVGRGVIVNTGATIDHECLLDAGVHISPGATLGGRVSVGMLAHVGIGATVIQGLSIGASAIVGAGAVVIRDVAAGTTVVGNPARVLRPGA